MSTVRIKDIIDVMSNAGVKLLTGKQSVDREITKVTVLDAPDGPQWLKGGELILTSAFIFSSGSSSLIEFVRDLIHKGACGLGIKTNRFITQIPEEVLLLSETAGFPILYIPPHLVWSDVIDAFYQTKENHHIHSWLDKDDVRWLNTLHLSRKTPIPNYMSQITANYDVYMYYFEEESTPHYMMLSNHVLIGDSDRLLDDIRLDIISQATDEIKTHRGIHYCFTRTPTLLTTNTGVFLFMAKDRTVLIKILLLLTILEEESLADQLTMRAPMPSKTEFIERMVKDELRASDYDVFDQASSPKRNSVAYAVIAFPSQAGDTLTKVLSERLRDGDNELQSGVVNVAMVEDMTIGILELALPRSSSVLPVVRQILNEAVQLSQVADIQVCCSQVELDARALAERYKEVRWLLRLNATLRWHASVLCFFDHGVLLTGAPPALDENAYLDIASLEAFTEEYGYNPLETLLEFLVSGNYKDSADRLHIHENSLRYRIRKISEYLAVDLSEELNRLILLYKIISWKIQKE